MLPINHTFNRRGSKWSGLRMGCDAENPATFLPRKEETTASCMRPSNRGKVPGKHRRQGPQSRRRCFSPSPHIWIDQGYNGVCCVAPMFTSEAIRSRPSGYDCIYRQDFKLKLISWGYWVKLKPVWLWSSWEKLTGTHEGWPRTQAPKGRSCEDTAGIAVCVPRRNGQPWKIFILES